MREIAKERERKRNLKDRNIIQGKHGWGVFRIRGGCYSYWADTEKCRLSASAALAEFLRQRVIFGIRGDACKRR